MAWVSVGWHDLLLVSGGRLLQKRNRQAVQANPKKEKLEHIWTKPKGDV